MASCDDLEVLARKLDGSENYRVLRRIPLDLGISPIDEELPHVGIILDTETTGLDAEIDEVIEIGMIRFHFSSDGRIGPVSARFQAFQQPSLPLDEDIVKLTGLSSQDLEGQSIDLDAVEEFVRDAALVVAHNAAFDRPFVERLTASFASLPWACSATEIDWRAEGVGGYRLEYLLNHFGYFHTAHRAIADCEALLFILSQQLSDRTAFATLVDAARRPTARIFAGGTPYESRHSLKRRGYRWNDGQNGYPRAWWRDVDPGYVDEELAFLAERNFHSQALVVRMTARDRFRSMAKS